MRGSWLARAVAPLLVLGAASSASAQPTPGVVSGTVRDSAGRVLVDASVWLDDRTPTPARGDSAAFALRDVPAGAHVLHARALGRLPFDSAVTVVAGAEVRIVVRMRTADAQRLDSVHVVAPAAPPPVHRKNGSGIVLTREEIARRNATRFGDLLRRLPGVTLAQITTEYGTVDYVYVMRGKATVGREVCPIAYFLDGQPMNVSPGGIDALVRPADLDSVEVYPSGAQAPARFDTVSRGRCGVIALWTRNAR